MEELDEYELEYEYLNRIMEFPENLLFFPNIEEPDITQINNIEEMDINQHYYLKFTNQNITRGYIKLLLIDIVEEPGVIIGQPNVTLYIFRSLSRVIVAGHDHTIFIHENAIYSINSDDLDEYISRNMIYIEPHILQPGGRLQTIGKLQLGNYFYYGEIKKNKANGYGELYKADKKTIIHKGYFENNKLI